jgi:hypothetical protein
LGCSGFGRIADIRRPPRTIASYLAKYLAKELRDPTAKPPKYFRRVRWSRGWCPWQKPTPSSRPDAWWIVYGLPAEAAISAVRLGYHLVALTGDTWPRHIRLLRTVRWQPCRRPVEPADVAASAP